MKLILLIFLVFTTSLSWADEFATQNVFDAEIVVLDEEFLVTSDDSTEPLFSNRLEGRDIAQYKPENDKFEGELQGQLSVVKEIPYSYPQLSRRTVEMRVLAELESETATESQ